MKRTCISVYLVLMIGGAVFSLVGYTKGKVRTVYMQICRNCAGRAYAVYRFRIRQIPYPAALLCLFRQFNKTTLHSPSKVVFSSSIPISYPAKVHHAPRLLQYW